eukprot:gene11396-4563_t
MKILQFNTLADILTYSFDSTNPNFLLWENRKWKLLEEITQYDCDIICLQEIDHFYDFFEPELKHFGYTGIFVGKKRCYFVPEEGCALFFKSNKFELLHFESFQITKNKPQNSILSKLKLKSINFSFILSVNHLKASKGFEKRRLNECKSLLNQMKSYSNNEKIPIIFSGDFNDNKESLFYQEMISSDLNLKDSYSNEDIFTTFKIKKGIIKKDCIDFIFYSDDYFGVSKLLEVPKDLGIQPSYNYGSDHLAVMSELYVKKLKAQKENSVKKGKITKLDISEKLFPDVVQIILSFLTTSDYSNFYGTCELFYETFMNSPYSLLFKFMKESKKLSKNHRNSIFIETKSIIESNQYSSKKKEIELTFYENIKYARKYFKHPKKNEIFKFFDPKFSKDSTKALRKLLKNVKISYHSILNTHSPIIYLDNSFDIKLKGLKSKISFNYEVKCVVGEYRKDTFRLYYEGKLILFLLLDDSGIIETECNRNELSKIAPNLEHKWENEQIIAILYLIGSISIVDNTYFDFDLLFVETLHSFQ